MIKNLLKTKLTLAFSAVLALGAYAQPANDTCEGAIEIEIEGPAAVADNTDATIFGPEGTCNLTAQTAGDTWYTFTTTEVMNLQILTEAGTSDDSQIAVFTIADCGSGDEVFTEIACGEDLSGTNYMSTIWLIDLEPGTYYIKAGTYGSNATGSYNISLINFGEPAANDNCEDATVQDLTVDGPTVTVTGSGTNATDVNGIGQPQVWEAFTITECADVTLDFCGTEVIAENFYVSLMQGCPIGGTSTFITTADYDNETCPDDENLTARFTNLEAGTYFYPVMSSPEYTVLDEYTVNFSAVTCTVVEEPVFVEGAESFEGVDIPECWMAMDEDNDTFNWAPFTADTYEAFDGDYSIASFSYDNVDGPLTPDNYLITPQLALGEGDSLYYVVSAIDANYPSENYSVLVSTTGNNIADFTDEVFTEVLTSGEWEARSIDLSDYNNQSIYIAFRHYNVTDMFAMALDAIALPGTVVPCSPDGISEVELANDLNVFPNPGNGDFQIQYNGESQNFVIDVMDLNGKIIRSEQVVLNTGSIHKMDLSNEAKGVYFARFINEGTSVVKRVVIQ